MTANEPVDENREHLASSLGGRMRDKLLSFLKMLEEFFPPSQDVHHTLAYARYGNDAAGYEDKLALRLVIRNGVHVFFLENEDLENPQAVVDFLYHDVELNAVIDVKGFYVTGGDRA